jgi:hypothetical protein
MVYWGRVKNGKIVLDKQSRLPEGARVRVTPESDGSDDPAYRLWELAVDGGPRDASVQHDHYIYSTPKRRREGTPRKKTTKRARRS